MNFFVNYEMSFEEIEKQIEVLKKLIASNNSLTNYERTAILTVLHLLEYKFYESQRYFDALKKMATSTDEFYVLPNVSMRKYAQNKIGKE